MSKRSVKNCFLSILFIAYIVCYKFFIFKHYMKYSEIISASFMVAMFAIAVFLLGFRKDKQSNLGRSVFKVILFHLCLYFFAIYGLGLFLGFSKNAYSLSFLTLLDNIIAPIIVILMSELLRYVVISANKDKKPFIFFFVILFIIFEIFISTRDFPLGDFREMFRICTTIIMPIIVKNVLLSYLCYHVGVRSTLLYRLVMDVYIFLVPIVPKLGEYIQSMILISFPFIIYISIYAMIDDRVQRQQPIFYKRGLNVWDLPVAILLIVMIALISGLFPHYMIGIGSDSMTPHINKGDAVIIRKYEKNMKLKKGDIIAYSKDSKVVVHRIIKIRSNSYITKGDANKGEDPKPVKLKQVNGVVKVRIPFIAYPTVLLNELIHG